MIDKLNMIQLEFIAKIDKQLYKAQGAIVFSTTLFSGLLLIIFKGDLYQFAFVSICFL